MSFLPPNSVLPLFVLAILLLWRYVNQKVTNPHNLPLPPGPPALPLIGNLHNFPRDKPWLAYDAMTQKYGDIIHLNVLGQHIIVLGSMKTISDLFEKRSNIYSDRLYLTMLKDLMGFDWTISLMGYGEWWRRHRRRFHQYFNANASERYKPEQALQTRALLKHLRATPEEFIHHIRHTMSATIMKVTYGMDVEENDEYVDLVEEALIGYSMAGVYGKFWVDVMPLLKYVPKWFPGANFHKVADYYRPLAIGVNEKPFNEVKEALANGTAAPSVTASMIENLPNVPNREEEEIIARNSAAIAYAAGADTSTSAAHVFIIAMVLYPEIQKKAQAELDAVVGPGRLPDWNDRPHLPYIEAIIKETLRWQLVTPLAVPHAASENDEYRGYLIPKGAVVIGNSWTILHDPVEYPEPEEFNPERFLKNGKINPEVRDPEIACFGFGRRVCPGRVMSINSLYSVISSVLHTFNITPAIGEDGNPIPVKPEMTSGIISSPERFQCNMKLRSLAAEALVVEASTDD